MYALGRCLETMAGVNQRTDAANSETADLLAEAAKAYEKLLSEYPDSAYNQKRYEEEDIGNLERHLHFLKDEVAVNKLNEKGKVVGKEWRPRKEGDIGYLKAQSFYAWFRTQNPKPEDRRSPFDSMPTDHPPFDSGPVTLPPIPEGLRLLDDDAEAGPAFPGSAPETSEGESSGTTPAPKPSAPVSKTPAETDGDNDKKPDAPASPSEKKDGE